MIENNFTINRPEDGATRSPLASRVAFALLSEACRIIKRYAGKGKDAMTGFREELVALGPDGESIWCGLAAMPGIPKICSTIFVGRNQISGEAKALPSLAPVFLTIFRVAKAEGFPEAPIIIHAERSMVIVGPDGMTNEIRNPTVEEIVWLATCACKRPAFVAEVVLATDAGHVLHVPEKKGTAEMFEVFCIRIRALEGVADAARRICGNLMPVLTDRILEKVCDVSVKDDLVLVRSQRGAPSGSCRDVLSIIADFLASPAGEGTVRMIDACKEHVHVARLSADIFAGNGETGPQTMIFSWTPGKSGVDTLSCF